MKNKYSLKTHHKRILADTLTPVSIYLKIRDRFSNAIFLESSEYGASDNSFSYICFNPIADIKVQHENIVKNLPDGSQETIVISDGVDVADEIHNFAQQFDSEKSPHQFINNGLFGYISYEAVRYFEDIELHKKEGDLDIPDIYYAVYQNIIAINLFNNEAYVFSHNYESQSNLEEVLKIITAKNFATYAFQKEGALSSNMTDEDFMDLVKLGKKHCQRGDVFQIVLSRRFSQQFKGDDFNLYRALRSINPSPYLFYFDYGNFKIFGSSPEAQIVVKNEIAEIHPIAGTFRRTGDDEQDKALALKLSADQKENSEHVMLVDLARNDLSRNGSDVKVVNYREVQFYSHVIHLVSKVTGKKKPEIPTTRIVADTFPAGTLSGAPKHRAMQLIEEYEKTSRAFYGGAIGYMGFNGNFNHAIIIRSFLSKDQQLHLQAGAGIVSESVPESELQEVFNKTSALTSALEIAENI